MLATYEKTDKDLFHHLSAPAKKGGSGLRDFAQELSKERMKGYMDGKKGMVIDSTGSNFKKVKGQKSALFLKEKDRVAEFTELDDFYTKQWFLESKSKINKKLKKILPSNIYESGSIITDGIYGSRVYGISISKDKLNQTLHN